MNGIVVFEDPNRTEQLLRAAEDLALAAAQSGDVQSIQVEAEKWAPDQRLIDAAEREMERRKIRMELLPGELIADTGWAILLDLFVASQHLQNVPIGACAERWRVSDPTAIRHIAALIQVRLVERVSDYHGGSRDLVRLTTHGRGTMARILTRFSDGTTFG